MNSTGVSTHREEIAAGDRFEFGENWRRFLESVDEARIETAVQSLRGLLGVENLESKSFLDVGCGSGLFSLAAHRLGASVVSFDYDLMSVVCCRKLKQSFGLEDGAAWRIEEGSALDDDFLSGLGTYEVVYSWGVLHHTGKMWPAIEAVSRRVGPGGVFSLAIYNDQGSWSERWLRIKKRYNRLPRFLHPIFAGLVMLPLDLRMAASAFLRFRPMEYIRLWTHYDSDRGMSRWRDIIDWVGGLPFEVAKPEELLRFLRPRGFELVNLKTRLGNLGCNEFVFRRPSI
ncbi:MAG: class I SAM-dependent methyltransferase [Planctomycetota bacterium]